MRVWLVVAMLSLLVSCDDKDIDGVLKVFSDFTLVDDEGYRLSIAADTYEAEFSLDPRKREVELEIDDVVADYDRDFEFNIPDLDANDVVTYDLETKTEQRRLLLPNDSTGQPVRAEVVISNRIIEEKPPQVFFDRCGSYLGIQGGLAGLFRSATYSPAGGRGDLGNHIYSVASLTKSELSVVINFVVGEETVAFFEGRERRKYRNLLWIGKCGDYDRPVINRD